MSLFALQCVISVIFVPCAAVDRACCRVSGQGVKKNDYQCVIWWLLGHIHPPPPPPPPQLPPQKDWIRQCVYPRDKRHLKYNGCFQF